MNKIARPLAATALTAVLGSGAWLFGGVALQPAHADSTGFSIPQYGADGMGLEQRVIIRSRRGYRKRVYCQASEIRTACSAYDTSRTGENNEADAKPIGTHGCQSGEEGDATIYAYCLITR